MDKICLDRIDEVARMLDAGDLTVAARRLVAFEQCADRSDCAYWHSCNERLTTLRNRMPNRELSGSRTQ